MLKPYTADRYLLKEIIKLGEGKIKVSTSQMAKILQVNQNTVNRALIRLEKAGYIERHGRDVWSVLKDENSD